MNLKTCAEGTKLRVYKSVVPNKANSHHFKNMIVGAQQVGMGIEQSSPYEIKHKYLDMEDKDMEAYVNIQRESGRLMDAQLYCWDRTLKHPLHAIALFLNPRFQYKRGVGTNLHLLQIVHEIFVKLDPTVEGLSQFGNELILFRDAKRGFGDRAAIPLRSEMIFNEYYL
ncbi:hypothetical protein CK203_059722 [Vitis vinifera]|uniref:Uncharacterized protein n=1 Tax=Vitis vinifera TaxID=29760 RepID=A0A438G7I6_VITVI|nr:hypothetical protein CK203_059722 [Vitis vinifera]